jgi:hypothetical protein
MLHLIPLSSSDHGASVDLTRLMSGDIHLCALDVGIYPSRINFNGVFAVSKNPDHPSAFGYVQLFRTGGPVCVLRSNRTASDLSRTAIQRMSDKVPILTGQFLEAKRRFSRQLQFLISPVKLAMVRFVPSVGRERKQTCDPVDGGG